MSHVTSVHLLLGLAVGASQSRIEVEIGEVHHPMTVIDDVPLYPHGLAQVIEEVAILRLAALQGLLGLPVPHRGSDDML